MQLNPTSKSITYSIERISDIERSLNEIEKNALEKDEISGDVARDICGDLSIIRDALCLKRGVQRHKKWAQDANHAIKTKK